MRVIYSRRATRDLDAIASYLRDRNPAAARRVRDAIRSAIRVVREHPGIGRAQESGLRKYTLTSYPYLIFYEVDEDADIIGIVTIRHAARDDFS